MDGVGKLGTSWLYAYLACKILGDDPLVEAFVSLVLGLEELACESAGLAEPGLSGEQGLRGAAEIEHASHSLAGLAGEAEELAVLVELPEAVLADVEAMRSQQPEPHGRIVHILHCGVAGPSDAVVLPMPEINFTIKAED